MGHSKVNVLTHFVVVSIKKVRFDIPKGSDPFPCPRTNARNVSGERWLAVGVCLLSDHLPGTCQVCSNTEQPTAAINRVGQSRENKIHDSGNTPDNSAFSFPSSECNYIPAVPAYFFFLSEVRARPRARITEGVIYAVLESHCLCLRETRIKLGVGLWLKPGNRNSLFKYLWLFYPHVPRPTALLAVLFVAWPERQAVNISYSGVLGAMIL